MIVGSDLEVILNPIQYKLDYLRTSLNLSRHLEICIVDDQGTWHNYELNLQLVEKSPQFYKN